MRKRKEGAVAWGARSPKRRQAADQPGDFGRYMSDKVRKLGEQFQADATNTNRGDAGTTAAQDQDKLFDGVSIYVNGCTTPSHQELRVLMVNHGGNFENYFSKSRVTHIICSNLADSKLKEFRSFSKGLPVIKPDWIIDSIECRKLLPYAKYQLLQGTPQQRKLSSFFGSESKSGRDGSISISSTSTMKIDVEVTSKATNVADQVHAREDGNVNQAGPSSSSEPELHIDEPVQVEESEPDGETDIVTEGNFSKHNRAHSTLGDPNFVQNYFKYSRLHFIGTWRNRFQQKQRVFQKTESKESAIIHIDMDCFFVAVVTRRHPEMAGKPVAVCHSDSSKGTAEISSANYEARNYGVKAGMFVRDAKSCCPLLTVVPYDFDGYEQVADRFYDILHQHSPIVQAVSCDEAYMDVTGAENPAQVALTIRQEIFEATQCTASAGISGNLLLARLATKRAKPNGQYEIQLHQAEQFMAPLRVEELPGVGHSLRDKLHRQNILTCSDLAAVKLDTLQQHFGLKTGEMLWNYARGIDHRNLQPAQERKSVGAEVNWGVRFSTPDDASRFLITLSEEVSTRLKKAAVLGRMFTLKVRKRKSGTGEPVKFMGCGICDNISRSATLGSNTDDSKVILRVSRQLLASLNIAVQDIRGLGLQVTKLEPSGSNIQGQKSLASCFESSPSKKAALDTREHHSRAGLPPASELDYAVLRSLPPEVFAEINQVYKGALDLSNAVNAASSSSKPINANAEGAKSIFVPPLSQIDLSIVGELPTQLRKEIMDACKDAVPPHETPLDCNETSALWIGFPPVWIERFQNSVPDLLRNLAKLYVSEGCPRSLSQFLLTFIARTDRWKTDDLSCCISECSDLIRQYVEMAFPSNLEEVAATVRILRRMGRTQVLWSEVLDRIMPLIQDNSLRLYGGYLKL